MDEIWLPCRHCPGEVWVSNLGNVKTEERLTPAIRQGIASVQRRPPRKLKPWLAQNGYLHISIKVGPERKKYLVHRLVALTFLGEPELPLTVNHKDGNKLNNCVSNLEWTTLAENTKHQWANALVDLRGAKHPSAKLKDSDIMTIRESREPVSQLALRFGVSTSTIYKVKQGRRWGTGPR